MRFLVAFVRLGALSTTLAASLPQSPLKIPQAQDAKRKSLQDGYLPDALNDMIKALADMQNTYFNLVGGTWPDAIDWTAAVMGTHVSGAMSSLVNGLHQIEKESDAATCVDLLGLENLVNKYFAHITVFYYNENAMGLRQQAYDDMQWVVLGWLESIKFSRAIAARGLKTNMFDWDSWHGLQFAPLAAHRARIFYELAEKGWDEQLCGGGMVWNPDLEPYKNSITNELFVAASVGMYLYFPGDNNTLPFMISEELRYEPHDLRHLRNAIKSYRWLKEARLKNEAGLYHDGYHITGWHKNRDGSIDPGTRRCDSLDRMIYTYNQGVILSAGRGLWIATGHSEYLEDSHELIESVIKATGWPNTDRRWNGLGRGGVLEEFCDHELQCSQDGQTFKGIFFHHMTEFCRPLAAEEQTMLMNLPSSRGLDESVYQQHMARCKSYSHWIEHNAEAALKTRNNDGLFGMWWGIPTRIPAENELFTEGPQVLPPNTVDYKNPPIRIEENVNAKDLNDRGRGRTVESQSGGLAVVRARWHWRAVFGNS